VVEKALGGVVKSGSSKFADVLEYAVPPEEGRHGFFLMNYGNHDGEVVTGMIGCGAQICLFTTGRGTPTGFPFVPVIKITGNEETYKRMKLNMDFDASPVIRGEASVEELGGELFEKLLAVAEGQQTVAEMLGADELFCIARHS
jgi:altronate dehydratase large subunit